MEHAVQRFRTNGGSGQESIDSLIIVVLPMTSPPRMAAGFLTYVAGATKLPGLGLDDPADTGVGAVRLICNQIRAEDEDLIAKPMVVRAVVQKQDATGVFAYSE